MGRVSNNWLIAAVLWLLPLFGNASAPQYNWLVRNYAAEQGLSQNTVTSIVEDKNGVIWTGTQFGVHKFDGYEFRPYQRPLDDKTIGLSSNFIRNMVVDSLGQLWVGTVNGLNLYNPELDRFEPLSVTSGLIIETSLRGADGSVWLGTNDGLYLLDGKSKLLQYLSFQGQSVTSIQTFGRDIYVTTDGQNIHRFDIESNRQYTLYVAEKNQNIQQFIVLDNNSFTIATNNGLMLLTDGQVVRLFPDALKNISAMCRDESGKIWLASDAGIHRLHMSQGIKPTLSRINTSRPLSQVQSITVDSNQLIWFGTLNDGVFVHNLGNEWIQTLNQQSGEKFATLDNSITALAKDKDGFIWQGSAQGVAKLDWRTRTKKDWPLGEKHRGVTTAVSVMYTNPSDNLWVGYRNGPLSLYDKKADAFVPQTNNLNVFITDIIQWTDNSLLLSTRDHGVFLYNIEDTSWQQFDKSTVPDYRFVTNRIQSLLRQDEQRVWLGSFDSGLMLFNVESQKVEFHLHQKHPTWPLVSDLIVDLAKDNQGGLLIGTANGFNYWQADTQQFIDFSKQNELASQTIYAIVADEQGLIWLSTNLGILLFEQQQKSFRQFNVEDGLPNNEFNSNSLLESEGFIYAGGVKGLAQIDAESVPKPNAPPPILLTDFLLAGKKVSVGAKGSPLQKSIQKTQNISLDYNQNAFSVAFNAVSYRHPLKVAYRFKLEPLESDWIETDYKRRFATYTNLDAGTYQFSVVSSINGRDWGDAKHLTIKIAPAPWKSPYAYVLYVTLVLMLFLLVGYFNQRKRQFEKETFERIKQKEQELSLALWGSGDEFWNYDVMTMQIYRQNPLADACYPSTQSATDFENYVHPDDMAAVTKSLEDCILLKSEGFEIDYRVKHKNGGWFWVMGKGKISEWSGRQPTLISGANKNIDTLKSAQKALSDANDELERKVELRTKELQLSNDDLSTTLNELKSTQDQLVESEKMASLGAMVAGVAHEINTPLGVAITSISHLQRSTEEIALQLEAKTLTARKFDGFSKELNNGLSIAQRNLDRAGELVNSFKQVSVDQSSELSREFNLRELVEDIINTTRPKFKQRDIRIHADIPADIVLLSYPGSLTQVLLNFITNSITHGFEENSGGHILISAERDDEGSVLLIYKDTGRGIDESHWEKVFEPFFTTNRAKGNTGLGMHISYNLVTQKLKGEIVLNSKTGDGVEFYLRLPLKVT